jgi:hypothetical protein
MREGGGGDGVVFVGYTEGVWDLIMGNADVSY